MGWEVLGSLARCAATGARFGRRGLWALPGPLRVAAAAACLAPALALPLAAYAGRHN